MLDLLAFLQSLPDIAFLTVFGFLSWECHWKMDCRRRSELRVTALDSLSRLSVGFNSLREHPEGVSDRGYYEIPTSRFHELVKYGILPSNLRALNYHTRFPQDDPLYMTKQWREYVKHHFESFNLACFVSSDRRWLTKALPHLTELRVNTLWIVVSGHRKDTMTQIALTEYPPCMEKLIVELITTSDDDLDGLVFPQRMYQLEIFCDKGTDPTRIPQLPEKLKGLHFRADDGVDISPYVDRFPRDLTELKLFTSDKPARVSQSALARFPSLTAHNLEVYEKEPLWESRRAWWCTDDTMVVDLSIPANYANMAFCHRRNLKVVNGALRREGIVALLCIAHWFPRLRSLELEFPVSLNGVRFPPKLAVDVVGLEGSVPHQVLGIPKIHLLSISRVCAQSLPLKINLMTLLKKLSIGFQTTGEVTIPQPPTLAELCLDLPHSPLPNLAPFDKVTKLKVVLPLNSKFDSSLLPPNVVEMILCFNALLDSESSALSKPTCFSHLKLLSSLSILSHGHLKLLKLEFPASLTTLCFDCCLELSLDKAKFPLGLRYLEMTYCGLANPWTTTSSRRFKKTVERVNYPEALRSLVLTGNRRLLPPPHDFRFPPQLSLLGLASCEIEELEHFRFPDSLDEIDLDSNPFELPRRYTWPPLSKLKIKQGRDELRSPESLAEIQRQVLGVELE